MNEFIGQSEINDGVVVLPSVVIVVVRTESLSQTVVVIEHRGNAVEPEPIEPEFVEPVFAVGEQEVDYIVFSIVETQRVPSGVLSPVVAVKVLVVRAIEST